MTLLISLIITYWLKQLFPLLFQRLTDAPTNVSTYPAYTENNGNPVITFWSQNNANASNDEACSEIPPRHPIVSRGGGAGPWGPTGNL